MAEEGRLQKKILKDLRSMKGYGECFKIMKASDDGVPDLFFTTALTGGIFIEAKALTGVASPMQKHKIKQFNLCGSRTFLCNSWEQWMEIKRELNMLDKDFIKRHHNRLLSDD